MKQQLAESPEKLAQAVSRIDSGVALRSSGSMGRAGAAAQGGDSGSATDVGPAQTMATPVKTKLQQVFEEYSRPRRPFAEVREGDTTTTAEEDTTEEEGSSQY